MKREQAAWFAPKQPSLELAVIVGAAPLTRTEVTTKVWQYIKDKGLQDKVNRRMIHADAALKPIFKKKLVSMFEMTKLVNAHLKVPKPSKATRPKVAHTVKRCPHCGHAL